MHVILQYKMHLYYEQGSMQNTSNACSIYNGACQMKTYEQYIVHNAKEHTTVNNFEGSIVNIVSKPIC